MSRRAPGLFAIVVAACGGTADPHAPGSAGATGTGATAPGAGATAPGAARSAAPIADGCEALPFAESTPVPEASGAGWLPIDGMLMLVVVGDSGNHGAYGIVDPETGATVETGALPLTDDAGDDIEGVAVRGDKLYGLTSAGWMRVWQRKGKAFELIQKAYPLGPVDLPDTHNTKRPPAGDGMICGAQAGNCGRNYEGLCLLPSAPAGAAHAATPHATGSTPAAGSAPACVGFAAAKADGKLYCLTEDAGKLVVHHDRAIAITHPGALADCAFSDDGTLWVGSNLFDLGKVYRVAHWDDLAAAQVVPVGVLSVGFPETLAVRGDRVYRMSDLGGAPSLMARYRCHLPPL
ncbi:MAG TPA: hypothetical protein VH165_31620 [Kofleriaceae bacterium]|nr:hypothetical protein [Kofleriaceae bacterium]